MEREYPLQSLQRFKLVFYSLSKEGLKYKIKKLSLLAQQNLSVLEVYLDKNS